MAKKKYNIENPDAIYRDSGKDISLGQFNQYYINYLNQKQEYLSKKAKMQLNFYYMENDAAVPNHRYCFLLTCPDTQELWYFADNPVTNVGTYALFKASILPALAENGYSVYGMDLGTIADASFDTTWDAWYQEFQILNNYLDVYDRVACKAGSIVFSEWALGMVNFANREFFEILNNPRQSLKDALPAENEEIVVPDAIPVTIVNHGLTNVRSLQKERDVLKIDEYIEDDKGVFVGQWPITRGFYLSFFEGHAFYIPVGFHIEPISGKYPEHLILVNVFLPNVIGFLIIPRKPFVAFGKANEYTRHTLVGIDFMQLTSELNRYHQADFMNLMRQMNKHYDLTGHETYGKGVTSTHLWGYKHHRDGVVYFEKLYTDPLLPNKYYSLTTIEILQAMMEYGPELRTNQAILGNMMSLYGAAMNALVSMGDIGLPAYDNPMPGYV